LIKIKIDVEYDVSIMVLKIFTTSKMDGKFWYIYNIQNFKPI